GPPCVGPDSGGPRDFVTDEFGGLVPEAEGDALVDSLVEIIGRAITEDWKATKGPAAAEYAAANFSTERQCRQLVEAIDGLD
ncbi:MAG: hypothetical protein AAFO29_25470, partial [Actinomycetota bacterium]